jgi:hypothetical protein
MIQGQPAFSKRTDQSSEKRRIRLDLAEAISRLHAGEPLGDLIARI